MSARHIVLLSDGTGNSRGKISRTNVWRVYEALDLEDPATPTVPRQFAFYDDGVGTSSFRPMALLGGAVGYGLARNVRDLYAFLCRTYRPGDRIYAFGFSRGAFTIRVLAGLIMNQGIVPYEGDEAELLRLVKAAYRAYRRRYRLPINYIGPLRDLRDGLIDGWARLRGKTPYSKIRMIGGPGSEEPVSIEFLGLWDTVAAYGLPVDELSTVIDKAVWPSQMPDHKLHPRVRRAVHALSIDDERNTFHPRLWAHEAGSRISQVWFAGVHSDVGGGYPDQGLSHVSLGWVMDAAAACELRFAERIRETQRALSDENGPMNDSRHGVAGYYRYNPRRLEHLLAAMGSSRPIVHESVMRRISAGQDAYSPIAIPPDFGVLRFDGSVEDGAQHLGASKADMERFAAGRERVFNRVWGRRVAYFATLFLTIALVTVPLLGSVPAEACTSRWCSVSPLIRAIGFVMPGMLEPWTEWYAANPGLFLLLGVPVALGLVAGGVLQRSIGDAMRRVWYSIPATRPSSLGKPPRDRPVGPWERFVQRLRTSRAYQAGFRALKHYILPGTFGAALAYAAFAAVVIGTFAPQDSGGGICVRSSSDSDVGPVASTVRLDAESMCNATGLKVVAGGTYHIQINVPAVEAPGKGWSDGPVKADLLGVRTADVTWPMRLATPLRRSPSLPWFMPIARIGENGADLYALRPDPSVPLDAKVTVLQARLVARSTGELFLYVNDAIGPPFARSAFYRNNQGVADVSIWLVPPPAGGAAPGPLASSSS